MEEMIKSKTKTIGFWMTPVMTVFFVGLSILTLKLPEKERLIPQILVLVFLTLSISQLWVSTKLITINTVEQTITFTNFFLQRKLVLDFKDLDGYVDFIEKPARGRPFRVIYLVRNESYVHKISSFIYSNLDEMEAGLKGIQYLGTKE
jgi:hypothetical protein